MWFYKKKEDILSQTRILFLTAFNTVDCCMQNTRDRHGTAVETEIKAGCALNSPQTISLAAVSISHMELQDWHL